MDYQARVDKAFFEFHVEADKAWRTKNYKDGLKKAQQKVTTQILDLLNLRAIEELEELYHFKKGETVSVDMVIRKLDDRLAELKQLTTKDVFSNVRIADHDHTTTDTKQEES